MWANRRLTPHAGLRMLAGFVIAPVAAAVISLVAYDTLFSLGLFPSGAPVNSIDSAASLGLGTGIVALVMSVFVALPAVIWLRGRELLSFGVVLLLGAGIGRLPFALIVGVSLLARIVSGPPVLDIGSSWYGLSGSLVRVAMGLICGTGAAAISWVVAFAGDVHNPEET